jgi:hypothetical protein
MLWLVAKLPIWVVDLATIALIVVCDPGNNGR